MTKIKFCGLSRPEDIEAANRLRPDFIGFVFAKGSKRTVTETEARKLREKLDAGITVVGVFADDDAAKIAGLFAGGVIDMIQLHGGEDEHYISGLRDLTGGEAIIMKAFEVRGEVLGDTAASGAEAASSGADMVLLDGGPGGAGAVFDWRAATEFPRRFFLAGGLDPGNVGEAIRACRPFAVDVSSGVETCGRKDRVKMEEFMRAVRKADLRGKRRTSGSSGGSGVNSGNGGNNAKGRFGVYGGQYVPETLMSALISLEKSYEKLKEDPDFRRDLGLLLKNYAGRPSLLYFAENMTRDLGGAKIYLKREDLNHTGAHKINNVLGQALLAVRMGKRRLIAETGAGQHGVATATAAALMGMKCTVFMGEEDTIRQKLNVYRMRLLGADVVPVTSGTATLKDAVSEAMREWTASVEDTHYCLGSVMGPHPFPMIVRDFQAVISLEIREQMLLEEGRLPDAVIACVGGGSNAIGSFYHFIGDPGVRLIGCEAAGRGVGSFDTAATVSTGSVGIFHGMKSYFCQDAYGQIAPVYSISAGLDYPGIGPEHAWLHDTGRAEYVPVTDDEAVLAFEYLSRTEGIIPAIESAHAVAHAMKLAPLMSHEQILVVNLSGRGDKDCVSVAKYRGVALDE